MKRFFMPRLMRCLLWRSESASVRAVSDGFACRVKVDLLNRNPAWPQSATTDGLIDVLDAGGAEASSVAEG